VASCGNRTPGRKARSAAEKQSRKDVDERSRKGSKFGGEGWERDVGADFESGKGGIGGAEVDRLSEEGRRTRGGLPRDWCEGFWAKNKRFW